MLDLVRREEKLVCWIWFHRRDSNGNDEEEKGSEWERREEAGMVMKEP
jgi:hypothetical protein